MRNIEDLGEDEIKRISARVCKAVMNRFGTRGGAFLLANADIVACILRETWLGIRDELERSANQS